MDENKTIEDSNEQQLNTSSTDEQIVPAAETISEVENNQIPPSSQTDQPQPETSNQKPETEKIMEVHHHAHNPAAPHHKKNWKAYFWEFLMLFLAVSCGFLAEYQLEHKIERDREKKFIQTFIEDLKTDTADIRRVLGFRKQKWERMDSLTLLLSSRQINGYENELYYFGRILI